MIEFKKVKLNINNIDILSDISFSIADKKTVCFLGNKSSGKTAILKLISGIYKSFEGEILIDGIDIKKEHKLKVGILNDKIEIDNDISVYDYLSFYGNIYHTKDKNELDTFIDDKLSEFSLMSYKHTFLGQIDKETYKFIDLIRVLIDDPDIILFDNIFFGDNVEYHERMYNYIKTMLKKKTIIFASRNTNFIEDICDYYGILDRGHLVIFDKKNEVHRYADIANKIEVEIISNVDNAVNILKNNKSVVDISYSDNNITFSIVSSEDDKHIKSIESSILKELIDNGVKVYSYRKQQVRFEQLFSG